MRVLVTGGAGFIGHHLVRALVDRGDDVAVIDNFATGDRLRLEPYKGDIELIDGDIRESDAIRKAATGCEVIFHEAALPSVARSVADPQLSTSVNVTGTVEVMLAAVAAGVRRVVFAGSSSVYGNTPEFPRREDQRLAPESPYAATKAAAEYMVHAIGALHGVQSAALRYFNVFGPGQDPDSQYSAVIPLWIRAALENRRPILFGNGMTSRDFTHVENVVEANLLASAEDAPSGMTFNVACGEEFTLLELLRSIGHAVGRDLDPVVKDRRPGDVARSRADISRAQELLGYRVRVGFHDGIRSTVDWYRSSRPVATG
jgi:UDP-glucose 4-epimerase